MAQPPYIGRFAPSPTGDLHFGSLVAAVGSFLQAKCNGGAWLVRVEDIDPPREVPGSATRILQELARLGMEPDPPLLYQSDRFDAYRDAWETLLRQGRAYRCRCSRKMLPADGIYPGTCSTASLAPGDASQVRLRVTGGVTRFTDAVQGPFEQDLAEQVGDFVIRRADGLPAYQLAVVVDDAFQNISEVVRGADLLDSTPRQLALQSALGLPHPAYCHLPLALLPDGSKLSKRTRSDPVSALPAANAVRQALLFLGQQPPAGLALDQIWSWAREHWDLDKVPRRAALPAAMVC